MAYELIVMKADLARVKKEPWISTFFALVAAVILMLDVFYTTNMIEMSDHMYMATMILLNLLPLGTVAYSSFKYIKLIAKQNVGILTNVYLSIYNVAFIFLGLVSTISIVDSRTNFDYFLNDKAIYALFWLVFNTLNASFVWNSCRTLDGKDSAGEDNLEVLLEKAAQKYALSGREQEIGRLLYEGKNNNEIAEILFLSTNTVKVHASNLYKKLGVSNRVQAIKVIRGEEI